MISLIRGYPVEILYTYTSTELLLGYMDACFFNVGLSKVTVKPFQFCYL
jgi:hypothetical protein